MQGLSLSSFTQNFLGHAPDWYKKTIVAFLVLNPFLLLIAGPYIAGWVLVLEFIFTLAMALKCYPLQPGGLLAFEGIVLGMTNPTTVLHEVEAAFPVILLLIFMVAGIYFMKELLLFTFTKILLSVRSKTLISFLFCLISAVLSAFLDALTVTAVVISVAVGFTRFIVEVLSGKHLMMSTPTLRTVASSKSGKRNWKISALSTQPTYACCHRHRSWWRLYHRW